MNRSLVLSALLLTLLGLPAVAEGAGGVEFLQVVGSDLWPFPGRTALPSTTGAVNASGGLGYGVDDEGNVIGGFGLGISSKNLNLGVSPLGKPLDAFYAGYGGTIQGWQHRWGPVVALATTRLGFGGADWVSQGRHSAGFSMLGTAGLQMGVTIFPWFTLGAEAGVAGTITFVAGEPFLLGYAPTIAIRLLWGSF